MSNIPTPVSYTHLDVYKRQPLDSTSVHPESYKAAKAMMEKLGIDSAAITGGGDKSIEEKIKKAYGEKTLTKCISAMASELCIGEMTLTDIIEEMCIRDSSWALTEAARLLLLRYCPDSAQIMREKCL